MILGPKSSTLLLGFVLLLTFSLYWFTNPFSTILCTNTISLAGLSPEQQSNIRQAANALNRVVLKPRQELSFNKIVGRREFASGYSLAPSYLGPNNTSTMGGGICLVSSALYQMALECGLTVLERVPHMRTTKAIAPGLDATVWFGQADLRLSNNSQQPIMITASTSSNTLAMKIWGQHSIEPIKLTRLVQSNSRQLSVQVMANQGKNTWLVSRDLYFLSR